MEWREALQFLAGAGAGVLSALVTARTAQQLRQREIAQLQQAVGTLLTVVALIAEKQGISGPVLVEMAGLAGKLGAR